MTLKEKIKNKEAVVGIVGIGYVGQELGIYIAKAGYKVIGFDIEQQKVKEVNDKNISSFTATKSFAKLKDCDIISINVPTPIDSLKKPNLRAVESASEVVAKNLKKDQLIILESTVAPGTTRQVVLALLEKSSLKVDKDFFLAFSSERTDFGNPKYDIKNTPKIVAGYSEKALHLIKSFYENIVDTVVAVKSLEIAEMSKILENTFRFVNINFINELSQYAAVRGIDIRSVIDAAKTKPFGFMPFYPGAGISGHCIPVDPFYLLEDAKKIHVDLEILQKAMDFHEKRIRKIVNKALEIVKKEKEKIKMLLIGVSEKRGAEDARESVGMQMIKLLEEKQIEVFYHDPFVPKIDQMKSSKLTKEFIKEQDVIIIVTPHENIDYEMIFEAKKPIIDPHDLFFKKKAEYIYKI